MHQPNNYKCPFCQILSGDDDQNVYSKQSDIIYKNLKVTAFISSHQWMKNKGHVLIIPNKHFENIYDLPDEYGHEIFTLSKKIALAMKQAYACPGISTRQHNEPAGNQEVWHFHTHVFPRYDNDNLYLEECLLMEPEERKNYAELLKKTLDKIVLKQ